MKKIIGVAVVWLWAFAAMSAVTVTNVVASQRPGTKLVDITYDLSSTETNAVKVFLLVSQGANAVNVTNLAGDAGSGVAVGTGKSMVWNMGADWNGRVSTGVVFTITVGVPAGGDPSAVSWEVVNARWTKNTYTNGAVTMSDRDTRNMWLYSVNTYSGKNWYEAMSYCDNLVYAGYSDWRLPDRDTLAAQYSQKSYFSGVHTFGFWSSTPYAGYSDVAWLVEMSSGSVNYSYKSNGNIVWPMRDGQLVAGGTATADLDSRDYTLTVVSAYGTPVPNIGTNLYAWRATVTASVDQAVVEQGIKWQCSGWSGAGSVPVSGATNTTGLIILTNPASSIAWNWQTLFSITNVTAVQRSGTKLVDITYDLSSAVTNVAKVFLSVNLGSTVVNVTNLTGDAGAGVTLGTGKSIIWNMGAEWNGNIVSGAVFTVSATPAGGDLLAADWAVVNSRWIKNMYANGDITMGDRDTGRMWLYNANPCGTQNWYNATNYCDSLTYAGRSDWRLPDLNTLQIQKEQRGFSSNVQDLRWYWSSTAYDANRMWCVIMGVDSLGADYKSSSYYVWPMRDGLGGVGTVLGGTATANLDSRDYTLTVTGGTGSGSYACRQQVAITAHAPPEGQLFDRWIGDTQYVASVTSATTMVTLTAQTVALTAMYKDDVYILNINSGSGSGSYPYQQQVPISANVPPVGKAFDRWTGDTQYVASVTSSPTTVTMPKQTVILTATYKDACVVAWGQNDYGQTDVPGNLSNVVAIAGGAFHTLAVQANGTVVAWGQNLPMYGQTDVPAGLSNVVAVTAGLGHNLAVRADGTVAAWGRNDYGQRNVPAGLSNVVSVAAGYFHSLALRADGTVAGWGGGSYGESVVPPGLSNVIAIASGGMHSLALRADGTMVLWGANFAGQTNIPGGLIKAIAVDGGYGHNVVLGSNGMLSAWGYNLWGQANVPAGLSNITAIVVDEQHTLALRANGTVAAWGRNDSDDIVVPQGLSNVVSIAAGGYHSLALIGTGRPVIAPMVSSIFTSQGIPVFLQTKAVGELPLFRQWYKDGALLSGSTNAVLVAEQSGDYFCTVSNSQGTATGTVVHVTVWTSDADADGIPDSWEQLYFGGTGTDATATCSNGINTLLEAYVAGLDPTNPAARFALTAPARDVLLWSGVSGRVYSVYWSTNLLSGFQCLESNIPWTRGGFTNSAAVPCGYYKINVRLAE